MRRAPLRRAASPRPTAEGGCVVVISEKRRNLLRAKGLRAAERKLLRQQRQFGPQAELCRKGPCQGCGRVVRCEAHHEPPRSRGGKDKDTCALCPYDCHPYRHAHGREALESRAGRSIKAMVLEMRERLAANA